MSVAITELTSAELDLVDGGLTSDQTGNIGNACIAAGSAAAMVGAEPVAAFLIGFGIGCHIVASMNS